MPYFHAVAAAHGVHRLAGGEPNWCADRQSGHARFAIVLRRAALFARILERPRVIDRPRLIWLPLLLWRWCCRFGPLRTARNYRKIWMKEGSPLAVLFDTPCRKDRRAAGLRTSAIKCGLRRP